jgi:hypothetical protein
VSSLDSVNLTEPKTHSITTPLCNDNNTVTCEPCDTSFQGPGTPWYVLKGFIGDFIRENVWNILAFAYEHHKQFPRTAEGHPNVILSITVCTDTGGGANRVVGVEYEPASMKPDTALDSIALILKPDPADMPNRDFSDSIDRRIGGLSFIVSGHELERYEPGQGRPYRRVFLDTVVR